MFYQWRNKRCRPHIRCPIIYQSVIDPDLNPRTPHWLFSFFIFNWVCLLKSVMVNTVLGAMDSKKKMQCYLPAIYHLVIKTMLDSPNSKHCRTMTTTWTCTVQILSAAGIWRKRSPSCLPRQGGCELDLRAFFWVFLLRFHISEVQTSRSSVDTNKQKNKLLAPSSWRFPRFQRLALLVNLTSSSLLNFSKSLLCRERGRRNH